MQTLIPDFRRAIRRVLSRPALAAAATITLALGVGVNTAVFSFANWILLRPVPGVRNQRSLAVVEFRGAAGLAGVSYPNLADLGKRVTALKHLAGYTLPLAVVVQQEEGRPQYRRVVFASGNYFRVLGVPIILGRPLAPEDDFSSGDVPVAVISHRLWTSSFGADRAAISASVSLNGVRTRIIGVAGPGFQGIDRFADVDLWVNGSAYLTVNRAESFNEASRYHDRAAAFFPQLVGRLAPGASVDQAQVELRVAVSDLLQSYPDVNAAWKEAPPSVYAGIGVPLHARKRVQWILKVLSGVASLVLLVAYANVASLFLCWGVARRADVAVRKALGASPVRLARDQIIESLVVASLGGVGALFVTVWLAGVFRGPLLPGIELSRGIRFDWRAFGFAGVVTLVTGVLVGLVPAVAALKSDVASDLRSAGKTMLPVGRRWRRTLAAGQVALSLTLLIPTLLLVSTLLTLRRVDVGFDAERVRAFRIEPARAGGYRWAQSESLLRAVLAAVRAIPGVEEGSLSAVTPFASLPRDQVWGGDSAITRTGLWVTDMWVSPTFFRTMGILMVSGRTFSDEELVGSWDRLTQGVAIVSESLARRLFGTTRALGMTLWTERVNKRHQVIGVVRDTRWASLVGDDVDPTLYRPIPLAIAGEGVTTILVRSRLPASDLQASVDHAIGLVAPSLPVRDLGSLRERIDRTLSDERLLARALGVFSLLAIGLAALGVYAVTAFSVSERIKELGVRIALGARSDQVVALVLREAGFLGVMGSILGIAGGAGLSRMLASSLYGVSALEPGVYVSAAALAFAIALSAGVAPAWAATKADPIAALRVE